MAVVDSSVLILLNRINRLVLLKRFFREITITGDIYNEVRHDRGFSEIENACRDWIRVTEAGDPRHAKHMSRSEGIAQADASILCLAKERNDVLLSNDHALILVARSKGVVCWWLTGFLVHCLKKKIVKKKEAKQILLELVEAGMRLDNLVYAAVLEKIDKW